MENIATPLSSKNATLNAAAKRQSGGAGGLDKSLFDAFVSVDGALPDAKQRRGNPDLLAEKISARADGPRENGRGLAVPAKVTTHDTAPKAARPKTQQQPAANDTPHVTPQRDEPAPDTAKHRALDSIGLSVGELRKMLGEDGLRELQKILGLDEAVLLDDANGVAIPLVALAPYLPQEVLTSDKSGMADLLRMAKDNPAGMRDILLAAVNAMLNQARKDLAVAEEKLRETLADLATVGTTNSDDVVDAAVDRNLKAVDAWKAAVAASVGGDAAIAAGAAEDANDKAAHKAQAVTDDARPQKDSRAHTVAPGGRADASLANSQPSAVQTLPLLPTQLTGGQQRLPVANHNLDIIARPAGVANVGANYTTSAAARALGRNVPSLPQVYEQVTIRLHRMAKAGEKSMTVQLNPSELGRVDVKLDFAQDGRVTARITADNQQTLDLLQRDSRALERALTDAGLKMGGEGLQFSLRNGGDGQGANPFAEHAGGLWQQDGVDTPLASEEVIINVSTHVADGRVDIRI